MVNVKNMNRWVEMDDRLRANALAGKKRRSFEFELVDTVDILKDDKEDILDMIDNTVEYHAIAYNMTTEEAKDQVLGSLIYLVGYYDDAIASAWRGLIYEIKGLGEWTRNERT